jgi:hypothetical protein
MEEVRNTMIIHVNGERITLDDIVQLRAERDAMSKELARLRSFVATVVSFMRYGEEVAPLFRALAEMERAETTETGCGTLHPEQKGGV